MYRRVSLVCVLSCSFSLLLPSVSFGDVNLREVVCFGDSLTDNQSILPIYKGNPSELYGHDPMELVFDKNRQGGNELSNYAVAGFTSDLVDLEVELYEFNTFFWYQPDATLFQIEMGGNDIMNSDMLLANNAPGESYQADKVINNIINNWKNYLVDLEEDARSDAKAVFWTVPDITMTPEYYGQLTTEQEDNIRQHTERANDFVRSFDHLDSVIVLDLYELITDYVINPPTIGDITLDGPPTYGESDDLFADSIHPTAVSNGLIANELIALMNDKWDAGFEYYSESELLDFALNGGWNPPIPAPASMGLLALMVIGGSGRRRRV